MGRRTTKKRGGFRTSSGRRSSTAGVRIIGGRLRGSELPYTGQANTRPMKDRTREAIFNLLGPAVRDRVVFDLFAGTGALALEAISRGANSAVLLERHFPTATAIRRCADDFGIAQQIEVVAGDTFHWAANVFDPNQFAGPELWLMFCSPPYDLFVERTAEMLALIERMTSASPLESLIVVESDDRFDPNSLPESAEWDIRSYPPAFVAVGRVLYDARPSLSLEYSL